MDEKKIIEKRSSFRSWKERNKGKSHLKIYIIGLVMVLVIFSIFAIHPYQKDNVKNKKANSSNNKNSSIVIPKETHRRLTPTPTVTENKTENITENKTEKIIKGDMGSPLIIDGFEITIKSIASTILYTNIWIVVKNTENKERSFKIDSGTVITDNIGQQYEKIHVKRSAEIVQTTLTAKALREGAIFFERLKEGRKVKKLLLNINGQKAEIGLKE